MLAVLGASNVAGNTTNVPSREKIDEHLTFLMAQGAIPGLAAYVSTPDGSWLFYKGEQEIDSGKVVNSETVFEIGSNSKAFTGTLAELLIERGVLDPNKNVSAYVPWFTLSYNGVEPKIRDLIHHTSGLAFKTIRHIQQYETAGLEPIIQNLMEDRLINEPGRFFSYATANYTVLAFVIEQITGRKFSELVKKEILQPMSLSHTWVSNEDFVPEMKSDGHKIRYGQALPVEAPIYWEHAAGGYMHSTLPDMIQWTKAVQLAAVASDSELYRAINKSLQPDQSVAPSSIYGSFYGAGWFVFQTWGTEYYHSGTNPTFSSCVDLLPDSKTSIVVLANLNSNLVNESCRSILFYLKTGYFGESNASLRQIDRYAMGLSALSLVIIVIGLLIGTYRLTRIMKEKYKPSRIDLVKGGFALVLWMGFATAIVTVLPSVMFYMLPLSVLIEWGPQSIEQTIILCWSAMVLIALVRFMKIWRSPLSKQVSNYEYN
ncbi:serine hydrolase [Vibrio parahaemolyticus]|uniref:serine hydrolase domain-containing protein n=1 Tax=Vibrio sp. M250220 TaxID=3020894 RepID=UPI002853C9F2|nr:serine hydrolase [Vibrio parahaemolyticus]ELC3210013.1 beta-lactamase family protein [Vibrio parahaemolyticus]